MSDAIGPGDLVECLRRPKQHPSDRGAWPEPGRIYTVRATQTILEIEGDEVPCLFLIDCRAFNFEGTELAFWVGNFRPAGRRDDSLTRRLLEPLPDAVAKPLVDA